MDATKIDTFLSDEQVLEDIITLAIWQQITMEDDLDVKIVAVVDDKGRAGFSVTDQYGSSIDFLFKQEDPDKGFLLGKAGLSGRLQTLIFEKFGKEATDDQ